MKNKKKILIGTILALFLILIGVGVYLSNQSKNQANEGNIDITLEIVMEDESSNSYEINTDEEFLRGALEQENLIEGSESDFGLFVTTVDGYTVNDDNQEWWAFSKDGESLMTGVDDTPIEDGDNFEITLTVGY